MKAYNFSEKVKRRSRRIASASSPRGGLETSSDSETEMGAMTKVVRKMIRRLPDAVQNVLKAAIGEQADLNHVKSLLRQANQHRSELLEREAALEQDFRNLNTERKSLQELKLNLRGQLRNAKNHVGTPVGTVKRVPLGAVNYRVEAAPRAPIDLQRLAQNLKRFGQQTPVVVSIEEDGFVLITGYRRMEALRIAGFTHVDVRITDPLDPETAAALYIAENCLVRGVSLSEIHRLETAVADRVAFRGPLSIVREDDATLEEEMTLAAVTDETSHHLAEAAAWLSALRPYWREIDRKNKRSLVELLRYFAQSAKQLR